ncbi:MAG TPA: rhamnulokinase [Bacteroides sp.]|nr:rhamnulokinase [Bacteroides sp.]
MPVKQHPDEYTCIAVDMGAGSIRVMLGMIDREGISYREVHRINNEPVFREGHERWDMDRIVREIRAGILKAVDVSPRVPVSIGVDSWGVDFVLMNDRDELVDTPVSYRDKRTEGMRERWKALMPEMETFRRTGINFYPFNTLFQLLSMRDSDVLNRTSRILFLPCYINYLLSGHARNELTISSTSQMLGVGGDRWDAVILDHLHLDRALLGEVVLPGTRLGPVTAPGAEGMENIAVCGHDTACVVAAIPTEGADYAYISAGTWCIVGVASDVPLVTEDALRFGLTNERGYNSSYRILKNITGLWLLQGLKVHLPENTSYADMEEMTREGGDITQVIDPDDPGFYNPGDMKEAFDSYFRKTGQPLPASFSAYLLCAYDSICFSFRYHIEKLEQFTGRSIRVLHLLGGGSQSGYLCQRIASTCGRKVVAGPVEGAALGNILIQAMAMGRIPDLATGRELVRASCDLKIYRPEKETQTGRSRYQRFLELKEGLQQDQRPYT